MKKKVTEHFITRLLFWGFLCILFGSLFACDIQKKAIKTKTDRTLTESSVKTTTRVGDTVVYIVPNVVFKDTTIYTTNRQGTTLKTAYNKAGFVTDIECYSSMIAITERNERLLEEFIKDKGKEKTEQFDATAFLYVIIGLVFIVLIGFYFVYRYLKSITPL